MSSTRSERKGTFNLPNIIFFNTQIIRLTTDRAQEQESINLVLERTCRTNFGGSQMSQRVSFSVKFISNLKFFGLILFE